MLQYRPEIDGLRAIAVISVILFHAGVASFSGGFVGVDVFFVISGYLITSIIHREITHGTFSLVAFYERRARRILPALFLVCLTCILFAWKWMLPGAFREFAQSLVAVNVFASNVFFWRESGYFAAASELKPLLHTWTLAVEEQFYIIFPIVLYIARRLRRSQVFLLVLVLCIISFALAEWGSRRFPSASFYLLPTRAWELGVGALIALGMPGLGGWSRRVSEIGAGLGLIMIGASIVLLDDTTRFPSVWTLLPVGGAALVVVFADQKTWTGRLLSLRAVVGVGLISYSAYLWHQPLFAFARIRSLDHVPTSVLLLLSVATLGLAYFSWRFVEQPFRNKGWLSRSSIFVGSAALSAMLVSIGLFGHATGGLPSRLNAQVYALARWAEDLNPKRDQCYSYPERVIPPESACEYNGGTSKYVAVWGDSHANGLAPELAAALQPYRIGVKEFTFTSCPPATGYGRLNWSSACTEFNDRVMEHLVSNHDVQVVVLLGRWSSFIEGTPFDNQEGGVEQGHPGRTAYPLDENGRLIIDPARIDRLGERVRRTVRELLSHGKQVVLVYPVPEAGWHVPDRLMQELLFGFERDEPLSTSYVVFKNRSRNAYEQLDMLESKEGLLRVYPADIFCDTTVRERCVVQQDGVPLYRDSHHLNSVGNALLASRIVMTMIENGWLSP